MGLMRRRSREKREQKAAGAALAGLTLQAAGSLDEAERAYLEAERGDAFVAGRAVLQRAKIAIERHDLETAERLLAPLLGGIDESLRQDAQYQVGCLRSERGDLEGAIEAFQFASGGPDAVLGRAGREMAAVVMGNLGRTSEAIAELSDLARTEGQEGASAAFAAALLLHREGDVEAAIPFYIRVIDSADDEGAGPAALLPETVAVAGMNVGLLLLEAGRLEEAEAVLIKARGPETQHRPAIDYNLGLVLYEGGDASGALEAFVRAWRSEDPEQQAKAAFNAAAIYEGAGSLAEARDGYLAALESTDPELVRDALDRLRALDYLS